MKLLRLAAPIVTLVALLAGCSNSAGTAASAEGFVIKETELQRVVDGCREVGMDVDNVPRRSYLNNLVTYRGLEVLIEDRDLDISMADAEAMLQQDPQTAAFMQNEDCAQVAMPLALAGMLQGQITQEDFNEAFAEQSIEVNPRYGQWNPEIIGIDGTGSLSTPSS